MTRGDVVGYEPRTGSAARAAIPGRYPMKRHRVVLLSLLVAVFAIGAAAFAKGKPTPPPCPCAQQVGNCVLISCGQFDCVYQCPFP